MISRRLQNFNHNAAVIAKLEEARRANDLEDAELRRQAAREMRGLPTEAEEAQARAVEEHNAAVRERQRQYWEQQQQPSQPAQPQPAPQASEEQERRIQLQVRDAALEFMAHSDYYRTSRNFQLLTEFIDANGLDATKEASFHQAYSALRNKMERPASSAPAPLSAPAPVSAPADPNAGKTLCTDGVYRTERELDVILESDDRLYRKLLGLNIGQQMRIVDGYLINTAKSFGEFR